MTTLPVLTNQRALRTEILVDKSLNSRQTSDDAEETRIKKLADSMKVQGVLHPPVIMRTSQAGKEYAGKKEAYILVAGFRRQGAMDLLGQSEGDYRLAPATWGLKEAMAANMIENLQREDLTTYDTAMQCARMAEEFKMTGADIAKMIRSYDSDTTGKQAMSEGHVNNLIRCARKLHPSILKAWKEGHPAASMRAVVKLASHDDHPSQVRDWKELTEPKAKGQGTGAGGDDPKVKRKPSQDQIVAMVEKIRESGKPDAWKEGAIDALKWAGGTKPNIPGIKADAPKKGRARKAAKGDAAATATATDTGN